MGAPSLAHDLERVLKRQSRPVGTVAGQRVEDVGDRDDAPGQFGDPLGGQTGGVAASVEALMVGEGDFRGEVQQRRARVGEDVVADLSVALHHFALPLAQLARLQQDRVGDRHLADVVHGSGEVDRPHRLLVEAVGAGQQRRVPPDAADVSAGLEIALTDRLGQPPQHLRPLAIDQPLALRYVNQRLPHLRSPLACLLQGAMAEAPLTPAAARPLEGAVHMDQQLVATERLDHVAVRSALARRVGERRVVFAGCHQHGDLAVGFVEFLEQGHAALAGHVQVADDEVVAVRGQQLAGPGNALGGGTLVSIRQQGARERLPHRRLIVDDEDPLTGHLRMHRSQPRRASASSR